MFDIVSKYDDMVNGTHAPRCLSRTRRKAFDVLHSVLPLHVCLSQQKLQMREYC